MNNNKINIEKNDSLIEDYNYLKKDFIKNKIMWLLEDTSMTLSNLEYDLENVEDEISDYRDDESNEEDDLTLINDLISKKEDLELKIDYNHFEIEKYNQLLNKLKVKKNTNKELDEFCRINKIKIN